MKLFQKNAAAFQTQEQKDTTMQKPVNVLLQKGELKTQYRTQSTVLPVLQRGYGKITQLCIVLGVVLSVIVPVTGRLGLTVDPLENSVTDVAKLPKSIYSLPVENPLGQTSGIPTMLQWNCMTTEFSLKNRDACLEVRQVEMCDEPMFLSRYQLYCEALRATIQKQQFECVQRVAAEVFPEECLKEALYTEKVHQKCMNADFFTLHKKTCENNLFYIVMSKQQQCRKPRFFIENKNICEETRTVLREQAQKCELSEVYLFGHQQICEHLKMFIWQVNQGVYPVAQQGIYGNVGLPLSVSDRIYSGMVNQIGSFEPVLRRGYNAGVVPLSLQEYVHGGVLPLTTAEVMQKRTMFPFTTGNTANWEMKPITPQEEIYSRLGLPLTPVDFPLKTEVLPMMTPRETFYNKPIFA